jgi:hypothetical protein
MVLMFPAVLSAQHNHFQSLNQNLQNRANFMTANGEYNDFISEALKGDPAAQYNII